MIIELFRILIVLVIIFFIYSIYKYAVNPKRKLEKAHHQKNFYILDDEENVKKNFLLTYKGVLFEGEKYLGTTENSFDVISITIGVVFPHSLKGLSRDDIFFMEKEILIRYPYASIEWRYPIKSIL
ncbi:hypothetical protein HNQ94_000480 [Salirhabdus euzebyi]|uniref:Sigma-w pathway protein ysdB n=1 Tax=Salirhabdus euzebyi TaxID=394506 RepID=A0A841PTA8_9BACI|nr:sigma-w pathway protein ysdB [Salirhabdus euzebyi]MBB6452059.1 hypothetical protein [Salirhabdus euzebyi]